MANGVDNERCEEIQRQVWKAYGRKVFELEGDFMPSEGLVSHPSASRFSASGTLTIHVPSER